jgi:acetolactate decarboxylase
MKNLFLPLLALFMLGCSSPDQDMIFHYSVLKALDNGVLEGNMTVGELKKHGDLGLGTYNGLDGEMVVLNHVVYRVTAEGKIVQPQDEALIPYSVISFYNQQDTMDMKGEISYPVLKEYVNKRLPSKNLFYAFCIRGKFDYIKCGSASKQTRPYNKSLLEMLADRPVFEGKDISGTLVGFWCPAYIGDINTEGFHLHFLSDDRTLGGHLMQFRAKSLQIGFDTKSVYKILLPDTEMFSKAPFRDAEVNY